jgi:hypothetical protein
MKTLNYHFPSIRVGGVSVRSESYSKDRPWQVTARMSIESKMSRAFFLDSTSMKCTVRHSGMASQVAPHERSLRVFSFHPVSSFDFPLNYHTRGRGLEPEAGAASRSPAWFETGRVVTFALIFPTVPFLNLNHRVKHTHLSRKWHPVLHHTITRPSDIIFITWISFSVTRGYTTQCSTHSIDSPPQAIFHRKNESIIKVRAGAHALTGTPKFVTISGKIVWSVSVSSW